MPSTIEMLGRGGPHRESAQFLVLGVEINPFEAVIVDEVGVESSVAGEVDVLIEEAEEQGTDRPVGCRGADAEGGCRGGRGFAGAVGHWVAPQTQRWLFRRWYAAFQRSRSRMPSTEA